MRPARTKLRIRSVKLDGLTFDQQCDRLREVLLADRRYIATREFHRWAVANKDALYALSQRASTTLLSTAIIHR